MASSARSNTQCVANTSGLEIKKKVLVLKSRGPYKEKNQQIMFLLILA